MRQLKNIDISFISLVNKGANKKTIIYKSDKARTGSNEDLNTEGVRGEVSSRASFARPKQDTQRKLKLEKEIVIKGDDERGIVYGIVYSPDEVDAQGDFATSDDIRKAAYNFMKNKNIANIDKEHDFKSVPAYVAESWIIRRGDALFPHEKEGAWAVGIKLEDFELKELVKSGEIKGLSMAGKAEVEEQEDLNTEGVRGEEAGKGGLAPLGQGKERKLKLKNKE